MKFSDWNSVLWLDGPTYAASQRWLSAAIVLRNGTMIALVRQTERKIIRTNAYMCTVSSGEKGYSFQPGKWPDVCPFPVRWSNSPVVSLLLQCNLTTRRFRWFATVPLHQQCDIFKGLSHPSKRFVTKGFWVVAGINHAKAPVGWACSVILPSDLRPALCTVWSKSWRA